MNDGKAFEQVQAALLNSECSPEYTIERALLAVLQFYYCETGKGLEQLFDEVERVWHGNDLGDPELGR